MNSYKLKKRMLLTNRKSDLTSSVIVSVLRAGLINVVLILNECGAPVVEGLDKAAALNLTPEEAQDYHYLKKKWEENLSSIEKALELVKLFPVLDAHNDFPWTVQRLVENDLGKFNFTDLSKVEPWASFNYSQTDLRRLHEGHVGTQFWASFAVCTTQRNDYVALFLEQIDVIHRLIDTYPDHLKYCDTAECIVNSRKEGKIVSLIGVEGGHAIASSVAVMSQLYNLGARYLTLTHQCSTPWAPSSTDDASDDEGGPGPKGLTPFGEKLIDEMNRIGMMIDLSHAATQTVKDVIARSKAPVIFSHSSTRAVCNHHRNLNDDILQLVKKNGGIIMTTFYATFLQCDASKNATLDDVAAHMEHIRQVLGSAKNIGLGSDFDGVDRMPEGLEDVSKYPYLFAKLIDRGWELEDLIGVAFKNFVRVMSQVEIVSDMLMNKTRSNIKKNIVIRVEVEA